MVATAAAIYTATTDGESFYVQDGDGGFHRDNRGMIVTYDTADDAVEVAAALTECRPIRTRWQLAQIAAGQRPLPAPVQPAPAPADKAASYTANYEYWPRVRYHGSLIDMNGAVLSAEECGCRVPDGSFCDGYRLEGAFAGRYVVIEHSRRTSFTVLPQD